MPTILSAERNQSKKNSGLNRPNPKATVTATTKAQAASSLPDYAKDGYGGRTYTRSDGSQGNYGLEAQEYTKFYSPSKMAASAPQAPSFGSSGSGGGGYGGGGGGGGGVQPTTQAWIDSMLKQLASGHFKAPAAQENKLAGMIDPAIQADLANAGGAYNSLDAYLAKDRPNPYANMQLSSAQVSPELAQFIQSQGGDLGAYQMQVDAANAGGAASAANWQNFAKSQQAATDQSLQGSRDLSQAGRTQATNLINGQRTGLTAASSAMQMKLEAEQRAQQQQLDQQKFEMIMQILAGARDGGLAMPTIPGA